MFSHSLLNRYHVVISTIQYTLKFHTKCQPYTWPLWRATVVLGALFRVRTTLLYGCNEPGAPIMYRPVNVPLYVTRYEIQDVNNRVKVWMVLHSESQALPQLTFISQGTCGTNMSYNDFRPIKITNGSKRLRVEIPSPTLLTIFDNFLKIKLVSGSFKNASLFVIFQALHD